jgi:hypothetical protein
MPRRKYGHMVGACPPTPPVKCRLCKLSKPCPVHKGGMDKPSAMRGGKMRHLRRQG